MEKNGQDCELTSCSVEITDLPVEVMQHIFNQHFTLNDLKRASLVCKSWYSMTRYTLNRSWLRIDGSMLAENVATVLAKRRGCRLIRMKLDNTLLNEWQMISSHCRDIFGKSVISLQLTAASAQLTRLPEILECFANLRELAIFTTNYDFVHPVCLPIFPKLTSLFLSNYVLPFLCGNLGQIAPNLQSFTISRDPLFNVIDIERFTSSEGASRRIKFYSAHLLSCEDQLKSLSSIRLDFSDNCIFPTDLYFDTLLRHFPCLRNVYIRCQQEEKIQIILQALRQCPEISELQISWNNHGSCGWLDMLGNIKKLKVLHLSGCFKCLRGNTFGMLTPFRNLAEIVSRLSDLHLAYCCIDDRCLAILCSKAKLNLLRLQHCHYITDAVVLNLAVICPTLQRLTVSQCAMIRPESIDELPKIMPALDITYHEM